jgi:hypothetical protein
VESVIFVGGKCYFCWLNMLLFQTSLSAPGFLINIFN